MSSLPALCVLLLLSINGSGLAFVRKNAQIIIQVNSIVNSLPDEDLEVDVKTTKEDDINYRPIIGILSQDQWDTNETSYIAASYVKSVESAGARVVPIYINQPDEYYTKLASSLNGFLFPGGSAYINGSSGYGRAGQLLYQLTLQANDEDNVTPLWGTCLGFEMLVYLASGRQYPLIGCSASDRADPLIMADGWSQSMLFGDADSELMKAVKNENITANFHKKCVLPETFANLTVSDDYRILSTNYDNYGTEYVSTIEHKKYPIFGVQWHPEKAAYEWKYNSSIPHTVNAVKLEHHTSRIFVAAARRNRNRFASEAEAEQYLIYNFSPEYVGKHHADSFQQKYFFPINDSVINDSVSDIKCCPV